MIFEIFMILWILVGFCIVMLPGYLAARFFFRTGGVELVCLSFGLGVVIITLLSFFLSLIGYMFDVKAMNLFTVLGLLLIISFLLRRSHESRISSS